MSEELKIELIEPAPKKRGRPAGVKNKPKANAKAVVKKPRKITVMPKSRAKKPDGFAVWVSAQHYWLICAIAESKDIPRADVLGQIINRFVATIDAGGKQ